ncbi:hypothetical protein SELR_17930 [Selenomonas ruminantium subsp. lactilytica TAM6421]|uniref:DUF7698 domain-containing protein n=1 Tax=Selenomonas ruminantium subsp. lactilytica (strain NBRC 103574 / TAM6421) TaxID=927704 RepID=I0GRW4_SELRL|nr:hypothetical protein [Selenomonas ruminantium]BAL83501.1 hypothetical protein SELR_17930 [Selenomonas ruminantium subsp. lactilytica TAM6421]
MTKAMERKFEELVAVRTETGNKYLDLHDVIWDNEIEEYIEGFKKMGEEKFTISVGQGSLIEVLARFQELGCKIEGVVDYRDKYRMFDVECVGNGIKQVPHYEKALLVSIA